MSVGEGFRDKVTDNKWGVYVGMTFSSSFILTESDALLKIGRSVLPSKLWHHAGEHCQLYTVNRESPWGTRAILKVEVSTNSFFKRFWNKRVPQPTISDPFFLFGYPCIFFSATLLSALPLPIRIPPRIFQSVFSPILMAVTVNCPPWWDDYPPKRLQTNISPSIRHFWVDDFPAFLWWDISDFLERVYTNEYMHISPIINLEPVCWLFLGFNLFGITRLLKDHPI